MVTTPNKQTIPPTASGQELKKMPKIEPATVASGQSGTNIAKSGPTYREDSAAPKADVANKDRNAMFKLPDKVSQKEILDGSFKYGGGRSAGNRSLADNMVKKVLEP